MQNIPLNSSSLQREPSEIVYWWSRAQKHKLECPHASATPADIACVTLWVTIFLKIWKHQRAFVNKQWTALFRPAKQIRSHAANPQTDHVSADSLNPDQQIGLKHFQQRELINPLRLIFSIRVHHNSEERHTGNGAHPLDCGAVPRSGRSHLDLLWYTFVHFISDSFHPGDNNSPDEACWGFLLIKHPLMIVWEHCSGPGGIN